MTATDTPGALPLPSVDAPAAADLAQAQAATSDDGSVSDWQENALDASEGAQANAGERVWQSLVDANTAVYLKTMQQYAAAYGAPAPDAITDPAVLGDIADRAAVSADSITNTRADRMDALAARYDDPDEARAAYMDWRDGQNARISAFEAGFTASAAMDDFFSNNPLLQDGTTEHVEPPETDQTDICLQAIAMGEVPYGTLPDFPAHLNCPHYVVRSTSPLADAALDPSALWLGQAFDVQEQAAQEAQPWYLTPEGAAALSAPSGPVAVGAQLDYGLDPLQGAQYHAGLAAARQYGPTPMDKGFALVNQQLSPVWRDLLRDSGFTYVLTTRKPSSVERDPDARGEMDKMILGVTIAYQKRVYLYGQNLERYYGPGGLQENQSGDYTDHIANTITHESGHILDDTLAARLGKGDAYATYSLLSVAPEWRAVYHAHAVDPHIPAYMRYGAGEMFAEAFASYNGLGWLTPDELRTKIPEAAAYFDKLVDHVWPTGKDAPAKPAGYQTPQDATPAGRDAALAAARQFSGKSLDMLLSYKDWTASETGIPKSKIIVNAQKSTIKVNTGTSIDGPWLTFTNTHDLQAFIDTWKADHAAPDTAAARDVAPVEAMLPAPETMGSSVPLPSASALAASAALRDTIRAQAGADWDPHTGKNYLDTSAASGRALGAAVKAASVTPEQAQALVTRWLAERGDIGSALLGKLDAAARTDPYAQFAALAVGSFNRDAGLKYDVDVAVQQVVADMLGLPFTKKPYWDQAVWERGQALAADPTARTALTALVRAQYQATQDYLKSRGITSVAVFRGITRPVPESGAATDAAKAAAGGEDWTARGAALVANKPLTSFAVTPDIAQAYGGVRVEAPGARSKDAVNLVGEVPAARILSLSVTGMGDPDNDEVVVAGSTGDVLSWIAYGQSEEDNKRSAAALAAAAAAPSTTYAGTVGAASTAHPDDVEALQRVLTTPATTLAWDPGAPATSWSSYSDTAARTTRVVQEKLNPFWQGLIAQAGEPAYMTNQLPSAIDARVATADDGHITGLHTQGANPAVYLFGLNITAKSTFDLLDHQAFAEAAASTLVHEESHVLDHYLGPLLGATSFGGSPAPRLSDSDAFGTIYGQSIVANTALPAYMRYNAHEAFAESLATYLGFGDITPQKLADLAPDVTRYFDTIMAQAAQAAHVSNAPAPQLGTLDLAALGAPARTPSGGLVADVGNATAQLDVDVVHGDAPATAPEAGRTAGAVASVITALTGKGSTLRYVFDPAMTDEQQAAAASAYGATAQQAFALVNAGLAAPWRTLLSQSQHVYTVTTRPPSAIEHDPSLVGAHDASILGGTYSTALGFPYDSVSRVNLYVDNIADWFEKKSTTGGVGVDFGGTLPALVANTAVHESGHVLDTTLGRVLGLTDGITSPYGPDIVTRLSDLPDWQLVWKRNAWNPGLTTYMKSDKVEMFADAFSSYNGLGDLSPAQLRAAAPDLAAYFDKLVNTVWNATDSSAPRPVGYQTTSDALSAPAPPVTPAPRPEPQPAGAAVAEAPLPVPTVVPDLGNLPDRFRSYIDEEMARVAQWVEATLHLAPGQLLDNGTVRGNVFVSAGLISVNVPDPHGRFGVGADRFNSYSFESLSSLQSWVATQGARVSGASAPAAHTPSLPEQERSAGMLNPTFDPKIGGKAAQAAAQAQYGDALVQGFAQAASGLGATWSSLLEQSGYTFYATTRAPSTVERTPAIKGTVADESIFAVTQESKKSVYVYAPNLALHYGPGGDLASGQVALADRIAATVAHESGHVLMNTLGDLLGLNPPDSLYGRTIFTFAGNAWDDAEYRYGSGGVSQVPGLPRAFRYGASEMWAEGFAIYNGLSPDITPGQLRALAPELATYFDKLTDAVWTATSSTDPKPAGYTAKKDKTPLAPLTPPPTPAPTIVAPGGTGPDGSYLLGATVHPMEGTKLTAATAATYADLYAGAFAQANAALPALWRNVIGQQSGYRYYMTALKPSQIEGVPTSMNTNILGATNPGWRTLTLYATSLAHWFDVGGRDYVDGTTLPTMTASTILHESGHVVDNTLPALLGLPPSLVLPQLQRISDEPQWQDLFRANSAAIDAAGETYASGDAGELWAESFAIYHGGGARLTLDQLRQSAPDIVAYFDALTEQVAALPAPTAGTTTTEFKGSAPVTTAALPPAPVGGNTSFATLSDAQLQPYIDWLRTQVPEGTGVYDLGDGRIIIVNGEKYTYVDTYGQLATAAADFVAKLVPPPPTLPPPDQWFDNPVVSKSLSTRLADTTAQNAEPTFTLGVMPADADAGLEATFQAWVDATQQKVSAALPDAYLALASMTTNGVLVRAQPNPYDAPEEAFGWYDEGDQMPTVSIMASVMQEGLVPTDTSAAMADKAGTELGQTAAHEIAHSLDDSLASLLYGGPNRPLSGTYTMLSEDALFKDIYQTYQTDEALQPYMRSAPAEMFAEGLASYYGLGEMTPQALQTAAPALYAYFGALEDAVNAALAAHKEGS